MQMKKFTRKSARFYDNRTGIQTKKISDYKHKKYVTLSFMWLCTFIRHKSGKSP